MNPQIFADDFKETPFWWERTPRPRDHDTALPASADVVIVGSGYTGLSAAIQIARHGRHCVVVDAEEAGWGCSSRNGGQVSTSIKPEFALLAKRFGADAALAILREGNNALAWVASFVKDNNIDCDFRNVGRFHGAHTSKALDKLHKKINAIPSELNIDAYPIAPHEQHQEIDSDLYHGGVIYPHHASIDPARYHRGLLNCAKSNGVEIVSHCKVMNISKRHDTFTITTTKNNITANEVLIATAGYTGNATPWQQRRLIPIGTYMIATEPLAQNTLERLIPNDRVITDTRRTVMYYRSCPERRRILFGGRVSLRETNLRHSVQQLHAEMTRLFPELAHTKITHSWMGFVGFTFDQTPHSGKYDGIHYSLGYCGSGISLASYFGMKAGLKILGNPEGNTALDSIPFPARFGYYGNAWFLAPLIMVNRWRDLYEVGR